MIDMRWFRFLPILVVAPLGFGQELRLRANPQVVSPGGTGSVSIELKSPAGRAPVALQWELQFPARQVQIEDTGWSAGPDAQTAGKQLVCIRQLRREPESYSYRCVLAGGQNALKDGVMAVVKFRIAQSASPGNAVLSLADVLGTSAKPEKIPVKSSDTVLTIR
jgi:hypothetical protein